MRFPIELGLTVILALSSVGCGSGRQLDTARINAKTDLRARWVIEGDALNEEFKSEVQMLVKGDSFKLHKKADILSPRAHYEIDSVSDGRTLWVYNIRRTPVTQTNENITYKHDTNPEEWEKLAFWRVKASKSWKYEHPESVEGVMCQRYVLTEPSPLFKELNLITRVWVDESRWVVLKLEKTASLKGKPPGPPDTYLCKEVELNPTFKSDDFTHSPAHGEKVSNFVTTMDPFWGPRW